MIVTNGDTDLLVLGYDSCNRWYCFSPKASRLKRFLADQINIKNSKIPNDWVITSYPNWNSVPPGIDYGDYVDHIFFGHPEGIKPYHLLELSGEYLHQHILDSFEYYEMKKAMNEIRKFHGLKEVKVPYIEEYEVLLMTSEERRQKELDDELDEYLRIGKELERKAKSGEDKSFK